MEIEVINTLNKNSAIFKALNSIPAANFAKFYAEIEPSIQYAIKKLKIRVDEDEFSDDDLSVAITFVPEFNLNEGEKLNAFKFSRAFNFYGLYGFSSQEADPKSIKWQQFLSANLGGTFYKKLLARQQQKQLAMKEKHIKEEYLNLIQKLNANKQAAKEIEAAKADFDARYSNLKNENGEIAIDESDFVLANK